MASNSIEQTLRAFQRAVTAAPTNVALRQQLAGYLAALDYRDEAARELELCTKLLAARGDLIAAIACAKQLLKLAPERSDILLFLSRHYADHPMIAAEGRVAQPARNDEDASDEPSELSSLADEPINITILTLDGDELELPSDDEIALWEAEAEADGALSPAPTPPPAPPSPPVLVRQTVPGARLSVGPQTLVQFPIFSTLEAQDFVALIEHLQTRRATEGETISTRVATKDDADHVEFEPALHIVVSGRVVAQRRDKDGWIEVGVVEIGGFFGEFELLTGRSHDVRWAADADTELLVLPFSVLDRLRRTHPAISEELWRFYHTRLVLDFLAGSSLFQCIDASERESLAGKFTSRMVPPRETVVREGQESDGFYIVRDGAVEVTMGGEPYKTLHAGEFFGVHAVARAEPYRATVTATEPTRLLVLPTSAIAQLFMLYPQLHAAFDEAAAERESLTERLGIGSTSYARDGFSNPEDASAAQP